MTDERNDRHNAFMEASRAQRARGETIEAVLETLRMRSASALESIKVLCELEGLSLREAKDAVHNSEAWADLRSIHERAQEEAIEVLRERAHVEEDQDELRATIDLLRIEKPSC